MTAAFPIVELEWAAAHARIRRAWTVGQHATVLGPTGSGKTVLSLQLAEIRDYVIGFVVKKTDPELRALARRRVHPWVISPADIPEPHRRPTRCLLWPPVKTLRNAMPEQRRVFAAAMDKAFSAGAWCLYFDELTYITDDLRLIADLRVLMRQARTENMSMLSCSQRPRRIPIEALSEASHVAMFGSTDDYDRKRLSELGVPLKDLRSIMDTLEPHQFLWVETRNKRGFISRVVPPTPKGSK